MKKRVIIFGDSYSSSDGYIHAWPSMLDENRYEVINFAVTASSTDYGIYRFFEKASSNWFNEDDIIIFQFSTPGRLNFSYQISNPETASLYLQEPSGLPDGEEHRWYHDNYKNIKWYISNCHFESLTIQHTSYLHLLKTFAENNPKMTIIILQNSFSVSDAIPILSMPKNMLKPNVDLYSLSRGESYGSTHNEFVKYTKFDLRVNHLTIPNRKILADLLMEAIETHSIANFTEDKFLKNVIRPMKTKEDYIRYVQLGILEDGRLHNDCFK